MTRYALIELSDDDKRHLYRCGMRDLAIANCAADVLLQHRNPNQITVGAPPSPAPGSIYYDWTNAHAERGITGRHKSAHKWVADAYLGGLSPQIYPEGMNGNCFGLGSLAEIKLRSAMTLEEKQMPTMPTPQERAEATAKARASLPKVFAAISDEPDPKPMRSVEQVREIIRKVASDFDTQSARDILLDAGRGTTKVMELKPEFYDRVYEACAAVLDKPAKDFARIRELIRLVAEKDKTIAKTIMRGFGVERLHDLHACDYPLMISRCSEELARVRPPAPPRDVLARVEMTEDVPPSVSPFASGVKFQIKAFPEGPTLVAVAQGSAQVVGLFNDARHAEFVQGVLQAACDRASSN